MSDRPEPAAPPRAERGDDERFFELRTHTMLSGSVQPTAAGLVVALLVALMVWPSADRPVLLAWLAAKLALPVLRLAHMRRALDGERLRSPPRATRRWFIALLLPDCLLWGLIAVLFAPLLSADAMVMLCLLVGVAAIVILSKGGNALSGAMFAAGLLSPPLVAHALLGTRTGWFTAAMLACYGLLLVGISQRSEQRYIEQARLRLDHERISEERRRALLLAEHSNAAKTRFLAAVSHEMRTPLNGVLGMTELLLHTRLEAEQVARLEIVRRSAQHLRTVISDLLDLSRIEFGKLELESQPFDLESTVREVTELLRPVAAAQQLELKVEFEPPLCPRLAGDASRIKQVLHNLIGNAIKFTARGEVQVQVQTTVRADAGVRLRLAVSDTGDGVDPALAAHLFDAFAQGPSADRRAGSGLGLTISRQLAREMGGDVVHAPRVPHGSRFTFTALLAAAPAQPAGAPGAAALAGLSGRVLVADDNLVNAIVASGMLEAFGLAVDVAADGAAALDRMARTRYDAVLMDCHMPQLDGFEATRRWRARERADGARRMPIVALTANAVLGDREQCLAADMDDYLAKPFEIGELHEVLRRWLAPPREAAGLRG